MDTLNLEIEANSPYNDGWTQQFYRDELKKVKAKKKEPKIYGNKFRYHRLKYNDVTEAEFRNRDQALKGT